MVIRASGGGAELQVSDLIPPLRNKYAAEVQWGNCG